MADEDLDLDVKNSGKGIKLLLIILIVLVLIIGGIGGFLLFTGGSEKDHADAEGGKATESLVTLYMPLGKPFTINFQDTSKARFLQVEISIMTRQHAVLGLIKKHMPIIQDDVINVIGSKSYEELNSQQGKNKLADEILKSIQGVIEEELEGPGVEAVYFTSFIMQ